MEKPPRSLFAARNIGALKLDARSLKFRLWVYFMLFSGILLAILWSLQVLFLNNYYQDMKIRETNNAAAKVETLYKAGEFSEIRGQIRDIYKSNDMYIEIQTENGIPIYIPNINLETGQAQDGTAAGDAQRGMADGGAVTLEANETPLAAEGETENGIPPGANEETAAVDVSDEGAVPTLDDGAVPSLDEGAVPEPDEAAAGELEETTAADTEATPHLSPSVYRAEIENLYRELIASERNSFTKNVTDPETGLITLEYAAFLTSSAGDRNVLYIFSPLYPMQSTIDILQNQLIYVSVIAMILAFIIAFFISRRISEPIENITRSAEKLGEGEYGVVFDGGHYSEITKLADTLTYTSLELAKSDNLQKDVIANVSHDLRTPLTMITSYAEMIHDLSGSDPKKRNAHLQVIIDEAGRLNKLVTDFLEISRMQSGAQEIDLTFFSLKELIENTLQAYTGFVEREGFNLVFISSGKGMILADAGRIKQVIDNLVANAFKYNGRDRTVEVKMFDEDGYVRCEVSDHGIGIPKKDLKYIWERYYRASTNYKRTNSTGLGLSIVKQILLLHGANFGVESALKKGSTFWFEIKKPTEDEIAKIEAAGEERDAPAKDGETASGKAAAEEKEEDAPAETGKTAAGRGGREVKDARAPEGESPGSNGQDREGAASGKQSRRNVVSFDRERRTAADAYGEAREVKRSDG
jgi:signal transduction histidine kinase